MALVRAPDMGVLYEEFVGMHFKMRNFRNDIVHCSVGGAVNAGSHLRASAPRAAVLR